MDTSKIETTIIVDENKEINLPTITIGIVSHGEDLINNKLQIDPNIRIYSRAGQSLCLNIVVKNQIAFVEELYESKNAKSSYQMLQEVAKHYANPEQESQYINTLNKESQYLKQANYTLKTIKKKQHNQIYIPFYDHEYIFTDITDFFLYQNQITVLDTQNHTSNGTINYKKKPNLAERNFFIKYPVDIRNVLREEIIAEFFKKFNLKPGLELELSKNDKEILEYWRENADLTKAELTIKTNDILLQSKLQKYSHAIFENIPFANNRNIYKEFENPDSIIYTLIEPEDSDIIKKIIKDLIILETDDTAMISEKRQKRIKIKDENDNEIIPNIKLSQIIDFLKSEGFVIINIIDFSCRYVVDNLTKKQIKLLNKTQRELSTQIDIGRGKKSKRKKHRKIGKETRKGKY